MVDYKGSIDYIGEGRKIRVWRSGSREYTETKKNMKSLGKDK